MKKQISNRTKLALSREMIRQLSTARLEAAAGGHDTKNTVLTACTCEPSGIISCPPNTNVVCPR